MWVPQHTLLHNSLVITGQSVHKRNTASVQHIPARHVWCAPACDVAAALLSALLSSAASTTAHAGQYTAGPNAAPARLPAMPAAPKACETLRHSSQAPDSCLQHTAQDSRGRGGGVKHCPHAQTTTLNTQHRTALVASISPEATLHRATGCISIVRAGTRPTLVHCSTLITRRSALTLVVCSSPHPAA